MKNTIQISTLICLMILTMTVTAKNQAGIYLSTSDYMNKHLSYEKDSKIRLNNSVWELPYVTVIGHDKKVKLSKNKIFGYIDQDKKVHRFYKNEEYQIVEEWPITIYLQIVHVSQSKGYVVMKKYYFSKTPAGKIFPLTFENLKAVYHSNGKFVNLLDQFFGNSDIAAYDGIHRTFKVNYFYTKALKND